MVTPLPVASPRFRLAAAAVLVAAVLLVYANSVFTPFLFDDDPSIAENPTIRHLADLGTVLNPPHTAGATVQGRPLLNLSFAVSYALSGYQVWGYHLLNILIHAAAALTLFALVRRTLTLPPLRERFGAVADPLAFMTALLWAVHPLQTESVTYIVQRAEAQVSLLYLLTLLAFLRGASANAAGWLWASVGFCAAGMASKEVMVSTPLAVLVYDRTFLAGSFRAALRQRKAYYLGLTTTLILLLALVAGTGWNRGGTIGLGHVGVPWWRYALAQFQAISLYLRLAFVPSPLIFDYGLRWAGGPAAFAASLFLVTGLAVAGAIGFARRTAWGFCAFLFFAVLAPSSSLIPGNRQTIAEHRMYLPLAAVLVLATTLLFRVAGRRAFPLLGLAALLFGCLTLRRNVDYRSVMSLYRDTVEKAPENRYALNNYADVLIKAGRYGEAAKYLEAALAIDPDNTEAQRNLGYIELQQDHVPAAIARMQDMVSSHHDSAILESNLADAYLKQGRKADAVAAFQTAIALQPSFGAAHYGLANTLLAEGLTSAALAEYALAVACEPNDAQMHNNYGAALQKARQPVASIREFTRAATLRPLDPELHVNLGKALALEGRTREAIAQYQAALRLQPGHPDATHFLEVAEAQQRAKDPQ